MEKHRHEWVPSNINSVETSLGHKVYWCSLLLSIPFDPLYSSPPRGHVWSENKRRGDGGAGASPPSAARCRSACPLSRRLPHHSRLAAESRYPSRRPVSTAKLRIHAAVWSPQAVAGHRHCQFPSVVPGVFMRAELGRPKISCSGTITVSARERAT